ncbi:MAG: AAA domain-containing protein [Clostridiaceae bacterium]|nr:AAA domain-containing protein [Clostridiaceae bacterium]
MIVREDLSERALNHFPFVFDKCYPIYPKPAMESGDTIHTVSRKRLYTYSNNAHLERIIELAIQRNIPFFTFNQATKRPNPELSDLDKSRIAPIVDITTMIRAALSNNAHILYFAEQLIDMLSNTIFIVQQDSGDDVLQNLPLYFESHADIITLYPELGIEKVSATEEIRLRRITDYNAVQLEEFFEFFSVNLIGHGEFKDRFLRAVRNFSKLNRIKEEKILSIFLLGGSGLGKTEVARIIKNYLNAETSLAKINFGNYSSHDALNSLIGSPAGYVGCESGELGVKLQKSKAGVIVCDEFEKTTRPVFNFFLELLEDGSFTDSLTREYDLDGYIIVFTSNLKTAEEFYRVIPPELQSRLDLICEFKPLSLREKGTFVDFQLRKYIEKLSDEFAKYEITPEIIEELSNVDYHNNDNLRDIKRIIEQKVIEFLNV